MRQAAQDATLACMLEMKRPLTIETYLAMNYPDGAPPMTAELMAEGAQHAIDWNLGRRKVRAWVRVKLGPRAQVRETSERYESFVGTAATRLSDPRRIDKVVSDLEGKPPESRQRLIDELEKLEIAARAALKRLKGR